MSSSSQAVAGQRSEAPVSDSSVSAGWQTALLCLFLIALVCICYSPVTHNQFLRYDDDGYITDNPHVRAGLTWVTVKWAFTTYDQANWHPLTWLSHALDCEVFGVNPAGHHWENVLLHAACAIVLFLLLLSATGFRWRSLMVAALFALHPINVESVAWAAERKNVLSMLFFLLAVYAYVWYARKPELPRYAAVFFLFLLALLSKPQVITFPFLLCLWDYWPLVRFGHGDFGASSLRPEEFPMPRSAARLILEKIPLFLLSAASAIITMKAQRAGQAVKTLTQYSLSLRVETALIAYVRYLQKAVWPSKLVALYPHPTQLYVNSQVAGAAALLLAVTALVVMRARSQPYLVVGWFWFLGSLVPMLGLVQVGYQAMADRYAYIPFVGLFLMVVWSVADWVPEGALQSGTPAPSLKRYPDTTPPSLGMWRDWPASRLLVSVIAVVWLLALGTLTYWQVSYWHDTESFWIRTAALTSGNYIAEDNLGELLFAQNRVDEAAPHFRAALAVHPEDLAANVNLGAYEDRRGNMAAAIARYKVVAGQTADVGMRGMAYSSMGFVYRKMGDLRDAQECFETALQLAPSGVRATVGLGLIAQDNGDLEGAVRHYSAAAARQPNEVVYLLLAQALQLEGHSEEAKTIHERVANSPHFAEAQREAQALVSRE